MRYFIFLCGIFLIAPFAVNAAVVDPAGSRVSAEKTALKADGIDNTRIVVTVRDVNLMPIENADIVLTSSRGKLDGIAAESDTTDSLGKAYFRVNSLKNGSSVYSAVADGVTLQRTATITYSGGLTWDVAPGDLIKIPDDGDVSTLNDTAVYYYGSDGRRYVFPNEKVYFTWYKNFSAVKIIPIDQMSLVPIGGNVTYKAGSKLVKFQTDVKTYLPTKGGVLRWVKTEDVARGLFGTEWNQQTDDITEAFYVNYTFGTPIASALDAPLDVLRSASPTIDADKGLE
ncbi:MAG: Ig-like domain-containing protein [Patescibacteria group bacterium]